MSTLKGLLGEVRRLVADPNFRNGELEAVEAEPYLIEDIGLGRAVPLRPLRVVVEEAIRREPPKKSDAWLAPRVHATLRLTRREAADKRLWNYLSVVEFPGYVRWRWRDPGDPESLVALGRFLGEDSKNALARLWWAAELTRNGPDYTPTVRALSNSQFARSWQILDALHHRPAALAVVDFLDQFGGEGATDYQGQVMAKAFNLALRTLSLDSLSENPHTDAEAVREWCAAPVDETKMIEELPVGPEEAPVPAAQVAAVRSVLDRLTNTIGLTDLKANRRATTEGQQREEGARGRAVAKTVE
jgi:hypothetical protein